MAAPIPKLVSIELRPIISNSGNVAPIVPEDTKQAVYAIYDEPQRLQFVGIAFDLRNALRQMVGRRPDKAFYYRAACLPSSDQLEGQAVRDAWFEECGGAPKGNKMAMERACWTQPVDAFSISEKGKRGAADQCAKELIGTLRARGCVEEFVPIPGLLDKGLVEFMPVAGLSSDEMDAEAAATAKRAAMCRQASTMVDGVEKKFMVFYDMKLPTRGGYMLDVTLIVDHKDTKHRIICSAPYYEPHGLPVEAAVEAALATLLAMKLPRQTSGMMDSATFPVNYFGVMQMDQWFGEEFAKQFSRVTGGELIAESERQKEFWRFNRVEEYQIARLESGDRHKL